MRQNRHLYDCSAGGSSCTILAVAQQLVDQLRLDPGVAPHQGPADEQALSYYWHVNTNYGELIAQLPHCVMQNEEHWRECANRTLAYLLIRQAVRHLVAPQARRR